MVKKTLANLFELAKRHLSSEAVANSGVGYSPKFCQSGPGGKDTKREQESASQLASGVQYGPGSLPLLWPVVSSVQCGGGALGVLSSPPETSEPGHLCCADLPLRCSCTDRLLLKKLEKSNQALTLKYLTRLQIY